jgi:NAD(P)-dependent dehydrogenase (short-subunit alcohol dehydrogenase family)
VTRPVWSLADIPPLHGRRALVTGVTSGLGEHVAVELARAGAHVVLAGRNPDKLEATRADVAQQVPAAVLHPVQLDLADLSSVRRAAQEAGALGPLSILVNNAGVMGTPHERTVDGFELQMGTNHLGHFALTGLLMPQLLASGEGRVVSVSSVMARTVRRVPTGELRREPRRYRKWTAYSGTKLANLLLTVELDRRARNRHLALTSVAAHPGYAATNLVDSGVNRGGLRPDGAILVAATQLLGQSAEAGAWPLLMAATAPGLRGGTYVGPSGPFELQGPPRIVSMPRAAQDEELAARLWEASEQATGVTFP